MSEPLFAFDEKGTRRIVETVRRLETMVRNQQRQWENFIPHNQRLIGPYLTKNDSGSTWTAGSTVTVTLYYGNTPGSETASTVTFNNVYVRMGNIPAGNWGYVGPIQGTLGHEVWNAGPTCP